MLALLISNNAFAESQSIKAKLKKLAELEGIVEVFNSSKTACLKGTSAYNPEKLVVTNPDMFAGIRPGSKYWPKVVTAFRTYNDTSCNCVSDKEYLNEYVNIYGKLYNESTLDSILSFYNTPAGKAYLKSAKTGASQLQTFYVQKSTEKTKQAMTIYTDTIRELGKASGNIK